MACDLPNSFVTNTYTPIRKIFDLINLECRQLEIREVGQDGVPGKILQISANLLRKMVTTEVTGHTREVEQSVTAALQHSEQTAVRHYVVGTVEQAVRQNDSLRVVAESSRMKEYIIKK